MRCGTLSMLLIVLLSPTATTAQTVDNTLFTSPEQREYLDYLREDFMLKNQQNGFNIEENQIPEIPTDGPIGPVGPAEYTLSGIMRRSDGSMTIWLNNQHLGEQELPANASLIREGQSYALRFATSTGPKTLRPGQTLVIESGAVQERFQRPPPAPAAVVETDVEAAEAQDPAATADGTAADTETVAVAETATAAGEEEAADTESLINNLPESVRDNAEALQSMIDNLQALQESISEVTNP